MGSHLGFACLCEDTFVVHRIDTMHGFTRLEVGEIPYVHTGDVVLLIGEVKIIAEETALEFLTEHFLTIGVNTH